MEMVYKGSSSGNPVWVLMTVIVVVCAITAIVRLLGGKH
jgi:hypothetical protein